MRPRKRCAIWCGRAKQAQTGSATARHRLSKFLLRTGQRATAGVKAWTELYMAWVRQLRYEQWEEATRLDYLHEVEHRGSAGERLEEAITEAVKLASPQVQEVFAACRRYARDCGDPAVTIVAELGPDRTLLRRHGS